MNTEKEFKEELRFNALMLALKSLHCENVELLRLILTTAVPKESVDPLYYNFKQLWDERFDKAIEMAFEQEKE